MVFEDFVFGNNTGVIDTYYCERVYQYVNLYYPEIINGSIIKQDVALMLCVCSFIVGLVAGYYLFKKLGVYKNGN